MNRSHSALLFAATLVLAACASTGVVKDSEAPSIIGAWTADVNLLDCASGQPTAAPPFRAVVVFHAGGTLSEASGPSVRRTPSFGVWSAAGASEYVATSVLLTYDANGSLSGAQDIRRTIRLSPNGDSFTAETTIVATDTTGAVVFQGCARGQAQRVN